MLDVFWPFPYSFSAFCTKNNPSNYFFLVWLKERKCLCSSLHQILLLIFNNLVQTHWTAEWKASEITDFCELCENRCLGGEGQDTCVGSLWEGETGGFGSHPSAWRMLRGKARGEMAGTPTVSSGPGRNVGLLELKGREEQGTQDSNSQEI